MTVVLQDMNAGRGPVVPGARPEAVWSVPGLGPLTRVSTSFGEVHAQALRERDLVRLQSGQLSEILEVDRLKLDAAFLAQVPDAHPVVIRAGAMGGGLPKADIVVSAGQDIGLGRTAGDAGFVRAGDLVGRPGIVRRPEEMMTYTNFRCARPVTVRIEGIWAKVA